MDANRFAFLKSGAHAKRVLQKSFAPFGGVTGLGWQLLGSD